MHLHVSLENIQLLTGKEDEKKARRTTPLLILWVEHQEIRQAIFHAGQIIRAIRTCPHDTLRDFLAMLFTMQVLSFGRT